MQDLKHWRSQDFGLGCPKHKSHAMMSSEIFKRETFCETKISQNKDQQPWPGSALNRRILLKKEGLNPKRKCLN